MFTKKVQYPFKMLLFMLYFWSKKCSLGEHLSKTLQFFFLFRHQTTKLFNVYATG